MELFTFYDLFDEKEEFLYELHRNQQRKSIALGEGWAVLAGVQLREYIKGPNLPRSLGLPVPDPFGGRASFINVSDSCREHVDEHNVLLRCHLAQPCKYIEGEKYSSGYYQIYLEERESIHRVGIYFNGKEVGDFTDIHELGSDFQAEGGLLVLGESLIDSEVIKEEVRLTVHDLDIKVSFTNGYTAPRFSLL